MSEDALPSCSAVSLHCPHRTRDPVTTALARVGSLTAREREVFCLLGRAESNTEIAECLGIGSRTVKFHITNIRRKLGLLSHHLLCAASYVHSRSAPHLTGPTPPVTDCARSAPQSTSC
ncbi:response regulator transcription factor [Streptomyces sp. NPDC004726]